MILFIIIFIVFAFISTILKFSLIERWPLQVAGIIIVSGFCFAVYPFSIHQNNQYVFEILQNRNIIHAIAALQIVESIVMITISLQYIKGHFSKSLKPFLAVLSVIPSFVLLAGFYLFQIHMYLKINNISFGMMALLYSLSAGVIIWLFMVTARFIIKPWELRVELKILVHFIQILLAMFLPLIINEIKVPFSHFVVDPVSIMVILFIVMFFVLLGVLESKYLHKKT